MDGEVVGEREGRGEGGEEGKEGKERGGEERWRRIRRDTGGPTKHNQEGGTKQNQEGRPVWSIRVLPDFLLVFLIGPVRANVVIFGCRSDGRQEA